MLRTRDCYMTQHHICTRLIEFVKLRRLIEFLEVQVRMQFITGDFLFVNMCDTQTYTHTYRVRALMRVGWLRLVGSLEL